MISKAKRIGGCGLFKALRSVIAWFIDLINPVRIVKYYRDDFKNNRISYVIAVIILCGLTIMKIGSMDFNTGTLFTANLFQTICGGLADVRIDTGGTVMGLAEAVYNSIKPVGTALVVMYWLIELVSLSVRDSFSTEILAMHFAKIIIGVILIENGFTIISNIVSLGNAFVDELQTTYTNAEAQGYGTGDETAENIIKVMDVIRLLLPLIIMFVMGLISGIVLNLQCISRTIKLSIYMSFAPIALADLAGNEHSTSIRYMKTVLALAIQGVILVAVNYFAGILMLQGGEVTGDESIMETITTATFSVWGILRVLAVGCAAIGMYSKSEEISRAIVGI